MNGLGWPGPFNFPRPTPPPIRTVDAMRCAAERCCGAGGPSGSQWVPADGPRTADAQSSVVRCRHGRAGPWWLAGSLGVAVRPGGLLWSFSLFSSLGPAGRGPGWGLGGPIRGVLLRNHSPGSLCGRRRSRRLGPRPAPGPRGPEAGPGRRLAEAEGRQSCAGSVAWRRPLSPLDRDEIFRRPQVAVLPSRRPRRGPGGAGALVALALSGLVLPAPLRPRTMAVDVVRRAGGRTGGRAGGASRNRAHPRRGLRRRNCAMSMGVEKQVMARSDVGVVSRLIGLGIAIHPLEPRVGWEEKKFKSSKGFCVYPEK